MKLKIKYRSKKKLLLYILILAGSFWAPDSAAQFINADSIQRVLAVTKEDTIQVRLLKDLGLYYWERNPDSAMYYSQQLIDLGKRMKDEGVEAHGISRYGKALNNKGNYPKALENLFVALRKFEKVQDTPWVANIYNHIGNVFKARGEFEEAIKYYLACKKLAEKNNSKMNLIVSTMNLGSSYLEINQIDSAIINEQLAYSISIDPSFSDLRSGILYNLGSIYFHLGEKEVAKAYFFSGIQLSTNLKQNKQLSTFYTHVAENYFNENQIDSSIIYGKKALEVARLAQYTQNVYKAGALLSNIYEKQHQLDSAFVYSKISNGAKDSLFNKERLQQLENLTFNERLYQEQKAASESKAKEERKHNLQFVAIASGLIILMIFFLIFSSTIIANQRLIRFLGALLLLVFFEFINLLIHPYVANITHHSPVLLLLAMVCLASLLIPLHHTLEHWVSHRLVDKNNKIRLAAARRTIAQLEGE